MLSNVEINEIGIIALICGGCTFPKQTRSLQSLAFKFQLVSGNCSLGEASKTPCRGWRGGRARDARDPHLLISSPPQAPSLASAPSVHSGFMVREKRAFGMNL